jgi:heat shock protein HslJ
VGERLVPMDGSRLTEMGCDKPRRLQDDWLVAFMEKGPRLSYTGDTLTFSGVGATLSFLNRKVANPDRPLVGSAWTGKRLIEGRSIGWMHMETYPALHFSTDGVLSFFDTCHTLEGRFVVQGTTLTVAKLVPVQPPLCTDERILKMSRHYAKVFSDGTLSFSIDANALRIERGEDGVVAYVD